MEWVYGFGLVILLAIGVAILAAGGASDGGAPDAPTGDEERPYEWGDELHEYSYRHPWEDE